MAMDDDEDEDGSSEAMVNSGLEGEMETTSVARKDQGQLRLKVKGQTSISSTQSEN
jgi:hypothetical protein